MNKETSNRVRLGFFVVAGILLLITGLYFIGTNKNMFGNTFKLYTNFRQISGLQIGNNVRYAGIDVGTVNNIDIVNDTAIRIEMVIQEKVTPFIRKNSYATTGTDGLMGNKLVNIDPGTDDSPIVKDGDEIPSKEGVNTDAMLRTLDLTNQNIATVSANVKDITENINSSKGTLYTVLMDTTLATGFHQTIKNIEAVSNNLNSITNELAALVNEVKQGKGTIGTLLKDTAMKNDLESIVRQMKKSSEHFSTMTSEMGTIIGEIHKGDGTLATLISDTATANHLKRTMQNLDSASKKLDEDLEAAKHNWLLKGYFKDQEKQKQKQQKANTK